MMSFHSFQAWAVFRSFISVVLLVLCFTLNARADIEKNPFLQGGKTIRIAATPRDLNQINLAVVVPPGKEPYLTRPGDLPPSPPAPGYFWVQLPLSNTPNDEIKPSTAQPLPPITEGSITQQPPLALIPTGTLPQSTTKEPLFTIEPPDILYGDNLNRKCLEPSGQFPSNSCNRYVNCWKGVAIEQTCPDGLLFNPAKRYCDYAGNVDCQGKSILPTTTSVSSVGVGHVTLSNPTQPVTSIPTPAGINPSLRKFCLRATGLFPGSTCGKFVNCWNYNAVEQDCPEGLHFSSEGYCDYPANVDCDAYQDGKGIAENFFASVGLLTPEKRACPLEFGTFRDRGNCSHYYTCAYHKIAAKYECPEGLSFSDLLGVCDYSYRVDCSKEPQIFRKSPVNPFPFNAFAHPELSKPAEGYDSRCIISHGPVRDVANCSSYYVCELGQVVASYVCPQGYKFSNELGVCDHEEKVNCDNSHKAFDINAGAMTIPNIPKEILSQVQKCVPGTVFRLNPQCTTACNCFRLNPQCTTACNCRNRMAEIIQCSAGLAYDSQMDKCVPAHVARC